MHRMPDRGFPLNDLGGVCYRATRVHPGCRASLLFWPGARRVSMGIHTAPNARAVRLQRPRRRAFTLIELLVALAIVAILGAVAYFTYLGYIKNARTAALNQVLGQMYTGILAYQSQPSNPGFPTDATNKDATNNTGAASYAALVQDLAGAGVTGLPATATAANIIAASWSYFTTNAGTPPSFTATAQANGGNGHVLCMDATHGVVDIGVGGAPVTPGVTCQ